MTTLLLAQDFPPMGGGIARLHGELARRYPRGELIVSTPADSDAAEVDGTFNAVIDRWRSVAAPPRRSRDCCSGRAARRASPGSTRSASCTAPM